MTATKTIDTVQETLRVATALHQRGELQQAEQAYRQIIAVHPGHFKALCSLSLLRAQQGSQEDAVAMLRRASVVAGDEAESHLLVGDLFARIGRSELSVEQYGRAVALDPAHSGAQHHLANALHRLGQIDAAILAYRETIALDPNNAAAHHNLGLALHRMGKFSEAIAHFRQALAIMPELAQAHASLGNAHRAMGEPDAAINHYRRALAIAPRSPEVHSNLGAVLHEIGDEDAAIASYQSALVIAPNFAQAHYNLAGLLQARGQLAAAVAHYARAVEIAPNFAEAHNNLGNALHKLQRVDEAIEHYKQAVALEPKYIAAHHNLGIALQTAGRSDEAIAQYQAALAIAPTNVGILNDLAAACLVAGRLEDAAKVYEKATALAPENMNIALNFARARPFRIGDPRLTQLEALAARDASLGDDDRIALHFALGKAFGDIAQPARSFEHLLVANQLKRRQIEYDERGTFELFYRVCKTATPDLLRAKAGAGNDSPAPIFIVGMPRSGTTLIEQILASHPQVHGAGEIGDLSQVVSELSGRPDVATPYPEILGIVSAAALTKLGSAYVERITKLAPRAARIVDKMPANFAFIGLIHLALPNARIIHARRDAVDTCLSCFSLLFSDDQPYTYDLVELGRYYRAYDAVMRHWQSALPEDRILEVRYEDVVADLEGQTRRILAHCGLGWHAGCLAFHRTRRPIHTASAIQVRQPLYGDSVGRARMYGTLLHPLLQELGPDTTCLDAAR